jgi:hypothetical protein
MDFLTAAADLCAFGWIVFPLAPGSKVPAIPGAKGGRGCLDATDDEEIIADWSHHIPNANIGIACGEPSGIIVVDFDPRNGSRRTVEFLASQKKTFPPTVEVETWSGGRHLYYRWESAIKNSKSKLGAGIDIKTTGGYVVAPPSFVREKGASGRYRWVRSPLGDCLPRLPRWAVEALKPKPEPIIRPKPGSSPKEVDGLIGFVGGCGHGNRNNALYWAARRVVETGNYGASEKDALISAAIASGLPRSEAEKTVASAFRNGGIA